MKFAYFFIPILLLAAACNENENILSYDTKDAYIYFAYPHPDSRVQEKFLDSVEYNFALDEDLTLTEKRIAIPIRIAGDSKPQDRTYTFQVVADQSTYNPNLVTLTNPVIRANQFVDTLYITIKRDAELQEAQQQLVLTMVENESFMVGHEFNRTMKIKFSDILTEPRWWNTWRTYFGPFHKEVFQKWMQIYYLGADPSPHLTDGTPGPVYYWNNMPSSTTINWYPVTHMYIGVLKKYFEDNVVYPNGDTSKDRILLP